MYLITYLDRVSLADTAPLIIKEFGFSKARWALFSALSCGPTHCSRCPADDSATGSVAQSAVNHYGVSRGDCGGDHDSVRVLFVLVGALYARRGQGGRVSDGHSRDADVVSAGERGLVQGVSHAASRFGAAVGPPVAVAIMIHYGWRIVFYVIGGVSLLWAIVFGRVSQHTRGA